ncbi:MAG: NTP transferase domain-containing protein [Alphaproteobacteria bacterium]
MAASRSGAVNPVAAIQGKSHKCLVEIAGVVMLEGVIETVLQSGCFDRVFVSIEDEAVLRSVPQIDEWMNEGKVGFVASEGNLADSVYAAVKNIDDPFPMVITTGDNALHTPELLRDYVADLEKSDGDVCVGFAEKSVIRAEFPDVRIAFYEFSDGGYSNCNLYGLKSERALPIIKAFRGGGQFGKKAIRIIKAFGMLNFLIFRTRRFKFATIIGRIGRSYGVRVRAIVVPYSFAPIDVDNPEVLVLTDQILTERRGL